MLSEELRARIKGDVASDDATLAAYSRDASIFRVKPQVIVFPKDTEDIQTLVRYAREQHEKGENISLTARAAGTDMSGGPLNDSIIVDFTRHINRIKNIHEFPTGPNEEKKGYVVAEPGVYFRDLEATLAKRGFMLPSYPASKNLCAVGGIIANNSGGEKTLSYGKTEKYVRELKVVLANGDACVLAPLTPDELAAKLDLTTFEGKIYRKIKSLIDENRAVIEAAKPQVSKNSAGYALWNVYNKERGTFDLTQLVTGSQGTLCLVTEATFRVVGKKKHSRLAVIFLNDLTPLGNLVKRVLEFSPESFEVYDDQTLKLAIKFFPDLLKTLKGNLITLGLQFIPEAWMMLRRGIPKLVLLAEITSDDPMELETRLRKLIAAIKEFDLPVRVTRSEQEAEKYWTIRRESFNLLRKRVRGRHTAPFIDDIIVRPEFLPEFLPRLNKILEPHASKMTYTLAGHAGDGNFHVIPLMDLSDSAARALIPKIANEVYTLVLHYKGSITAEHNDGLIRSPYLKQMYGETVYGLFEEVKRAFDPLNIFNPRKKVGSDLDYAIAHISTDNL